MTRSRTRFLRGVISTLLFAPFLSIAVRAAMEFETKPLGGASTAISSGQQSNEVDVINAFRRAGHYDEAEAQCLQALQQTPNDPAIKRLLTQIETERAQQRNASASLRRRIEGVIVPEVNVREASVSEVIDFLKEQAQTLSANKSPVNVVWEAPEQTKTAKVTLSLHEVPLTDALKYVTESVGLHYRVDAHAIVIYRPPATPPHAKP
jgi:hypothetical protein